jgi:hypothetical protein
MTFKQKVLTVYPETKLERVKAYNYEYTEYRYIVNNMYFSGHGETPREAWKDMWGRIEYRMLKKLEQ